MAVKTYRKTALVTAEQFLPGIGQIPKGVYSDGHGDPRVRQDCNWVLDTKEAQHVLRGGDYICTGPAGEQWNVAKEIFEDTYEEVDGPTPSTHLMGIDAAQITMGRGLVDVSRIEHEGRAGILFRPRDKHITVGDEGELQPVDYWPVKGDVVIWIENDAGAQVIQKYLTPFLPLDMQKHYAASTGKRECTCHPDDIPPVPCAERYALSECRAAATPKDHLAGLEKPIAHLVWLQSRRAPDDVEDYYEVARPGDKCVDGSDPFPVFTMPPPLRETTSMTDTKSPSPQPIKQEPIGYISRETFAELIHDNSGSYEIITPHDLLSDDLVPIFALRAAISRLITPPPEPNLVGGQLRAYFETELTRIIAEWEERRDVLLADPEAKARFLIMRSSQLAATAPEGPDRG